MPVAKLVSLTRVSGETGYNAFTDLTFYEGYFWITYRTGTRHVSPDGQVIVQRSRDGYHWEIVECIQHLGEDLRDPRLRVIEGRLILLAFSLRYYKTRPMRFEGGDSYFYEYMREQDQSQGGFQLVGTFSFSDYGYILWDVTKIREFFLVTGYEFPLGHFRMSLLKSTTLQGPWTRLWTAPEHVLPPNLGFTETDIINPFGVSAVEGERDAYLTLFCRTDPDSFHRVRGFTRKKRARKALKKRKEEIAILPDPGTRDWFGVATASPPFEKWELQLHRIYLKGPRAIEYGKNFIVVGRHIDAPKAPRKVKVFHYDGEFHPLLTLAEGKDGSYAGLCWDPENEDELLVSFYSDHARLGTPLEGKVNDVWVARLQIRE